MTQTLAPFHGRAFAVAAIWRGATTRLPGARRPFDNRWRQFVAACYRLSCYVHEPNGRLTLVLPRWVVLTYREGLSGSEPGFKIRSLIMAMNRARDTGRMVISRGTIAMLQARAREREWR